ncbi:SUMF1/EgtB/PvdO family nonheme iron enzyme [Verrucomicrobiaceae bacterium N1E253]|uniref:SUMF1/EgtB/PvdO family nonheme iron enzyme n=1 Tax=Oceaniferula marina TaxID=2748318 RepID=A0A851GA57_9BACT|nr:bifunctional serine/threonine-protein kinase/formylglycine-generating enzyme family protein [Oceaniferula marina]NWK54099.1 SUMF1/EgtB/PvdO family nonheme iron enzyme [Oceaniferula marina]
MRGKVRPEPEIPDHKVLRKIGGGSYGEVWLAQGVTGAMRAVKVVRREDFEDERGFEREFEGILKYEPISRDHPGLVNILHVGRSEVEGEFYYYVMELGDDIDTGQEINPVEYEARNLLTDLRNGAGTPLDPDFVIDVGVRLSEALLHLHKKGLAHRDIKPSNIIFVGGKAKLADIGLVAARGQRTFVGTEGFVPPEGPGSAQADVYGLGKVLYEMATGKDRLQFPELPDELPESANRKRWLALNQVICDICEPRLSKRTVTSAEELADALRRLQRGKRIRRRRKWSVLTVVPIVAGLILVGWVLRDHVPWFQPQWGGGDQVVDDEVQPEKYGFVKITSDLEDVEVYDGNGEFLGFTQLKIMRMKAGRSYAFEFRMEGYRTVREEVLVKAGETTVVRPEMSIYAPPEPGQEWVDNFGIHYQPMDGYHISEGYVRLFQWRRYEKHLGKETGAEVIDHSESGLKRRIILVQREQAEAYCRWQTQQAVDEGYLDVDQYISPKMDQSFSAASMTDKAKKEQFRPFQCMVKNIAFASMAVHSEPEGASVLVNGVYKGVTPMPVIGRIKPGKVELSLVLEGFRRSTQTVELKDWAHEQIRVNLQRNNSVVFDANWENSLGMRLVPVYKNLMVSAWETRVSDYQTYVKETKANKPPAAGFDQSPNHPVVQVSRQDAMGFCEWLTERERKQERITNDDRYRLLTDWEWSYVAGLEDGLHDLPAQRELRQVGLFPWGRSWPPERAGFLVGNLADQTASQAVDIRRDRTLLNYDDGFEKTSPVGSFPSNEFGVYDLAGNAHEWVMDDYNGQGDYGVLRGGGWNSWQKEHLYVTHRNIIEPKKRSNLYGFRVALVKTPPQPEEPETETELYELNENN